MRAERAQRGLGSKAMCGLARLPRSHGATGAQPNDPRHSPSSSAVNSRLAFFIKGGTDRSVLFVVGTLGQELFYEPTEYRSLPAPKAQVHVANDALAID
jgi:hypothetical protein